MDIHHDKLQAMVTAFDMRFRDGMKLASTNYTEFCEIAGDADHSKIELPFLESFAFMREWVGPRYVKNLASKKLEMTERAFEDTVSMKVREIQTDNWGLYQSIPKQMGEACESLWDRLAAEAITNPGNWIDGKNFFATDRKYGKSTICNTASTALSAAAFETAYAAMQMYNGHNGQPLDATPDLLIVGPELRAAAWEILELERVPDSSGSLTVANRNYKLCKIQVNPRLNGACKNYWYLACTKGAVKPVVVQKSVPGKFTVLNSENDENVFIKDEILYGCKAYGSAACAFPHLLYRGGSLVE